MLPMYEPRPLLEKVAERLAKGKPPEWLADYLERFARLIGYPVVPPEDPDLPRALAAIDLLDNEIKIYATIEEEFWLRSARLHGCGFDGADLASGILRGATPTPPHAQGRAKAGQPPTALRPCLRLRLASPERRDAAPQPMAARGL